MQPMMSAYTPTAVTTDIIQQYLDENKQLILTILENQNSGRVSECAQNQARLQQNLMYLAAIADAQPQPAPLHSQFPSNTVITPGARYIQHQAQGVPSQSLLAARSSMLYSQQQLAALYAQQQESIHNQDGMRSGRAMGMNSENYIGGTSGSLVSTGYPDYVRASGDNSFHAGGRGMFGASKADMGITGSTDVHVRHGAAAADHLYSKGSDAPGN